MYVLICAATCRTRAIASCPSRSSDAKIFKCCTPPLCALNPKRSRPSVPSTPRFGVFRWDYHLQLGAGRRRPAGVLAWEGHSSRAAPSCRRADGTPLQSLPEGIGELRKNLKNLCVAARSVRCTLVDRGVPRCGTGSSTGATLRSSPIRSATSQSRACACGPPIGVGIQSGQARAHRRDVSKNALRELPECVCNMGSLTSLYAPPEASMS
jgi:hypothetical protein